MKLWKMQILYQQLAVVDMQDPLYVNKSECKLPEGEKKNTKMPKQHFLADKQH